MVLLSCLRSGIRDNSLASLDVLTERSAETTPPNRGEGSNTSSNAGKGPKKEKRTIRRPDIMVIGEASATADAQLSLKSKKITAPRGNLPHLIVEVTSPSNSANDFCVKKSEYERAKVQEYLIIDRALLGAAKPRVIMYKLDHNNKYSRTEHARNEQVPCRFLRLRDSAASKLLNPPTAKTTASSPIRKRDKTI